MRGGVTRPPDRTYAADRVLFNPLFDGIRPQGIAHCATAAEVATSLAFARHHGLPFTARSGGHSFGGYSTSQGLVIDLEPANQVQVQGNGTATVGSGARLGDVYARLADRGVMIPAGSCPSVGIAGLTLGGGVGVVARKYGLTIDNLRAAEIVVADGRTLTCDANREPDLFWALRGGGGGNFGIVTSFTFATHPAPTLALASIHWPWSAAGAVLSAWLDWAPSAPDELWSNALLLAGDDKRAGVEPTVRIGAAFVGAAGALRDLLDSLVATVGAAPSSRSGRTVSYLDAMTYEGGGSTAREASVARSEYLAAKLPPAGIQTVVDAVARRQADPQLGGGGAAFDAYGGAINRVAPAATAFVHRDPLCGVLFNGTFADDAAPVVVEANRSWVDDLGSAVKPYVNGEAYQNYIDPRRADWADAYYGRNLDRLRAVKGRYDPDDVFHFAQSIPLP
ncbi:MAG: FAD-binding oxidoreductase [Acidimicrobiales bacterium]|nr:FAD-binding oxidoreductase [Acidimicrobiales bacterium]